MSQRMSCRCDFGLYAVFDGHNGTAAAEHCREVFVRLLLEQLPPGVPPLQSDTEVRIVLSVEAQGRGRPDFARGMSRMPCTLLACGTNCREVLPTGFAVAKIPAHCFASTISVRR